MYAMDRLSPRAESTRGPVRDRIPSNAASSITWSDRMRRRLVRISVGKSRLILTDVRAGFSQSYHDRFIYRPAVEDKANVEVGRQVRSHATQNMPRRNSRNGPATARLAAARASFSTPSGTASAGSTKRPRRSATMSRPFKAEYCLEAVNPVFLWGMIVSLLTSLRDAALSFWPTNRSHAKEAPASSKEKHHEDPRHCFK